MMDLNIIDYYIINCAIPSIVTIKNRYQIDFGKPGKGFAEFQIQIFTTHGHTSLRKLASYHTINVNVVTLYL